MKAERLYHSIRLFLCRNSRNRAEYLKKHNILGGIGENCWWGPWLVPLYPKLIILHDNVHIHRSTRILTHDFLSLYFSQCDPKSDYGSRERLGCVEIMDNVYIAMNTVINPNVRINRNCIVTAGSVVTADIPENSIVSGNPAKVTGKTDLLMAMRKINKNKSYVFKKQKLPDEIARKEWEQFFRRHQN